MDRTQLTIDSYDGCAPAYADKFDRFALYETPRHEFAELLPRGAAVLDLGCGPGGYLAYLAGLDRGFQLAGCDLSGEMLALARRAVPSAHFFHHDLRDAQRLTGSYDALIASFCIVHLDAAETAALLDHLATLARPGARLLLAWIEGAGAALETTSFGGAGRFWYSRHAGAELRARLAATDWSVLREITIDYPNPDGSTDPERFLFACRG